MSLYDSYEFSFSTNQFNRAKLIKYEPFCIWFTGLSGSGKSTLANVLEEKLHSIGLLTYILDGDSIRNGLNKDLDFSMNGRNENIRRVAEVARILFQAGVIPIVSLISPLDSHRRFARSLFDENRFLEIYLNTPFDVCEKRDPKGLYSKAKSGYVENFTGKNSPFEPSQTADLIIDTSTTNKENSLKLLLEVIKDKKMI
jgi:adenylyl-sulfate kinase